MPQLTFGLMSGVEKVRPISIGDILVTHKAKRFVVTHCDEDVDRAPVYVCVSLETGGEAVIFGREVAYRSC